MRSVSPIWRILLMGFCCISCQSYRLINITTYNPATITFPPEVKTVMIMNNAAQQPVNSLYQGGQTQGQHMQFELSADSMTYFFCLSLGKAMVESPIFNDVRLCEDTLRFDSVFVLAKPFTHERVKMFCDVYNVDALISLEKFYFHGISFSSAQRNFFKWNLLNIVVGGEMKAYCPGYSTVLTVPFMDTLQYITEEGYFFIEIPEIASETMKFAMRHLAEFSGNKIHTHFVPYWEDDYRWLFTRIASDWKRAQVFCNAEKWDKAVNEWLLLFERAKKWKHKAKIASNLALCHELQGEFQKAVEYAEIAISLYKENTEDDDRERLDQQIYLDVLKKRAADDGALSLQLRERLAN